MNSEKVKGNFMGTVKIQNYGCRSRNPFFKLLVKTDARSYFEVYTMLLQKGRDN